jgi:glycosyltransferase 2 family protein
MSRKVSAWGRFAGSALVFAVLVWRLGTGPFLDGLRTIDGGALAGAAGIALLTTVCYAWRWRIVAVGLGLDLSLPAAVAAYYRSLFLNATLPGGIVGDVHRGASHGRDVSDVGHALRAVAWERFAGQVVQVLLTVVVLLAMPSPVQAFMPWVAITVVVAVFGLLFMARARPGRTGLCGRDSEAQRPATSATGCSPAGRGWASRWHPRWPSPATRLPF